MKQGLASLKYRRIVLLQVFLRYQDQSVSYVVLMNIYIYLSTNIGRIIWRVKKFLILTRSDLRSCVTKNQSCWSGCQVFISLQLFTSYTPLNRREVCVSPNIIYFQYFIVLLNDIKFPENYYFIGWKCCLLLLQRWLGKFIYVFCPKQVPTI